MRQENQAKFQTDKYAVEFLASQGEAGERAGVFSTTDKDITTYTIATDGKETSRGVQVTVVMICKPKGSNSRGEPKPVLPQGAWDTLVKLKLVKRPDRSHSTIKPEPYFVQLNKKK
jgi:hypothetical protein